MDIDLRDYALESWAQGGAVLPGTRVFFDGRRQANLTLLLEYRSFTPLPLVVWRMVLYSPSSSSLMS